MNDSAIRVVTEEYWADKGGVRLWVYRKKDKIITPAAKSEELAGAPQSGA